MPPCHHLTLPTVAALPGSHRLPANNPLAAKALSKLSRPALLTLASEWLKTKNQSTCGPVLTGAELDDESIYEPAQTLDELREVYTELQKQKGSKREVIDRILEGDWRNGISLRQLAMADVQYLQDHSSSQKWTALKLSRLSTSETAQTSTSSLPRFHGPTFVHNLQAELAGLVKVHCHLSRLATFPITLLRIHIHDSPYNSQNSLTTTTLHSRTAQTVYLAFPDHTCFVYISSTGSSGTQTVTDTKSARKLIISAVPKALSRSRERYELKPTSLIAKSLAALVELRGPGRSTNCTGGWSIFADGSVEESPIAATTSSEEDRNIEDNKENTLPSRTKRVRGIEGFPDPDFSIKKRRKLLATSRFGSSGDIQDGKGLDKLSILLVDPFSHPIPSTNEEEEEEEEEWKPNVQLTFHGSHIHAGIRNLVLSGAVDGADMPGWMTGEEGVSFGVVREGRIGKGRDVGL